MSREVRLAAAGLVLIAVCYGLARFAYGLFLPGPIEAFGLDVAAGQALGSPLIGVLSDATPATIAFGVAAAGLAVGATDMPRSGNP
jgi:hypothetical protein